MQEPDESDSDDDFCRGGAPHLVNTIGKRLLLGLSS